MRVSRQQANVTKRNYANLNFFGGAPNNLGWKFIGVHDAPRRGPVPEGQPVCFGKVRCLGSVLPVRCFAFSLFPC